MPPLVWLVAREAPRKVKVFIMFMVVEKPLPVSIRLFDESKVEIVMLPFALKVLGLRIVLLICRFRVFALEWSGSLRVIFKVRVPVDEHGCYE